MSAPVSVPRNIYPYLNEIAERLFSRHAAVMIGSGFSRNAEPHSSSSPKFPDWSALGDIFYENLHGTRPDADVRYLSVPELAHEVEAATGRTSLNRLLQNAIPDQQYEPSKLHMELLGLPWTEVFTTNYDTLLERTCRFLTSQRYDIVRSQDSLVYSEKPRIIKLHGSIDSDGPYIVTDEDYRCYPEQYAPFVNTVRQALLENTLCLIGFSGNDPNFLQWIGWLHDNLGRPKSPKIYLISSSRFSDSQKRLLGSRNIVSIDMSEYSDITPDDHKAGLERFINYLKEKESEFSMPSWPPMDVKVQYELSMDQIRNLVKKWREQRNSYPGWVVLPADGRQRLWYSTPTRWTSKDQFPEYLDLQFVFELVWRMEKCLCPIDDQISFIEATIKRYDDPGLSTGSVTVEHGLGPRPPSSEEVRDMCHYLVLATMRYYREEGFLDRWDRVREYVSERISKMSPEHRARFYYEQALSALFKLDIQQLNKRLEEWPVDDDLPFWEAKRAALLAEIGDVSDASMTLERSLSTIRSRSNLKPVVDDYSLASQESIVMVLLKSVRLAKSLLSTTSNREFTRRWHSLKQYNCDPWGDLDFFQSVLDRQPKPQVQRIWSFDIGYITNRRSFVAGNKEVLNAYQFLLFCEETGIPFRIDGCSIATKGAAEALSRIGAHKPSLAMASLVRIGDRKVVEGIFNRSSIARFKTSEVDGLVNRYLESLERYSAGIASSDIQIAKVVPEIISRLCCRCSDKIKEKVTDFLIHLYRSPDRTRYKGISRLLQKVIEALSINHLVEMLPRLLKFPILCDLDRFLRREYRNPFSYLDTVRDVHLDQPIDREYLKDYVDGARSYDAIRRQWSIFTLDWLYSVGGLDQQTTDEFAEALWCRLDGHGLPEVTEYYRSAFLSLPHTGDQEPIEPFKIWFFKQQFPTQATGSTSIELSKTCLLCNEVIEASRHIRWSIEEAELIIKKLVVWWDSDKEYLRSSNDEIVHEFKQRFGSLVNTLIAVIKPDFRPSEGSGIGDDLRRLSEESIEYGLPARRLDSAFLHLLGDQLDGAIGRIEAGMTSSSDDVARDSFAAVAVMSRRVGPKSGETERTDFVCLLRVAGQAVRWRSKSALETALNTMAEIAAGSSWAVDDDIERSLLDGLYYLIDETAIHPTPAPLADANGDRWDVGKKLIVRREAAGLAYAIFRRYEARESLPDVLCRWESICHSDKEFAEIRNQWR